MRQNGHGAVTIEDVRTWIEETGLCIFLPRSAQAGFTTPTFVEAIAGQRTTEPTLELIATAESLLVRLEAEGVAVRLNLAGQPGDQPDYVVAGWVLPYIYALRGDRDWRRSPQLTGSRQVSQLAVLAAKQLDMANLNAGQLRDLLGREVTETAVLRALHELWKQLRIIPVVPEVGVPALWQPLRQRFQKAIAEGASTSQVTAISVLASIYLQAVIAASMEDVELFLSPLTSRSKIREVVRGLAATRQVHSTNMGHSPMYYVAGTLPEFPVAPSFQISNAYPAYRGSTYIGTDPDQSHDEEFLDAPTPVVASKPQPETEEYLVEAASFSIEIDEFPATVPAASPAANPVRHKSAARATVRPSAASPAKPAGSSKVAAPRPRSARNAGPAHPRERSRGAAAAETRAGAGSDRRRAPVPRATSSNGSSARPAAASRNGNASKGAPARNGGFASNGSRSAKPATNGQHAGNGHSQNGHSANGNGKNGHSKVNGAKPATSQRPGTRPEARNGARPVATAPSRSGFKPAAKGKAPVGKGSHATGNGAAARPSRAAGEREPAKASAAKRYSFTGSAKQAPKPASRTTAHASKSTAKPVVKFKAKAAPASKSKSGRNAAPARTATAKRRG
jgi:hypothetical protein